MNLNIKLWLSVANLASFANALVQPVRRFCSEFTVHQMKLNILNILDDWGNLEG